MSDDLRRRAARQAQTGNYWAGKTLGLIDRVAELEAQLAQVLATDVGDVPQLLRRLADGRREYAASVDAGLPTELILRHEAEVMDNIAKALTGLCSWEDLIASYAPSWRWPEFGDHNPLPPADPAGGEEPRT